MRSIPEGIAYGLLCPVINFLLFRALAQTHSLTSFALCGWFFYGAQQLNKRIA